MTLRHVDLVSIKVVEWFLGWLVSWGRHWKSWVQPLLCFLAWRSERRENHMALEALFLLFCSKKSVQLVGVGSRRARLMPEAKPWSLSFLTRLFQGSGNAIATEFSRWSCASFPKCVWGANGTDFLSSDLSRVVSVLLCWVLHISLGNHGTSECHHTHYFYACEFFLNKSCFSSTPLVLLICVLTTTYPIWWLYCCVLYIHSLI